MIFFVTLVITVPFLQFNNGLGPAEKFCSYSVMREVGAGSPSADTSPRGRDQETRSQPTGRTHLPSRQSGFSVAGAQSSSL